MAVIKFIVCCRFSSQSIETSCKMVTFIIFHPASLFIGHWTASLHLRSGLSSSSQMNLPTRGQGEGGCQKVPGTFFFETLRPLPNLPRSIEFIVLWVFIKALLFSSWYNGTNFQKAQPVSYVVMVSLAVARPLDHNM